MRLCTLILLGLWLQAQPGAKAMFYDPGDRGAVPAMPPGAKLRPVDTRGPFFHCGIHYWLETEKGEPVTERTASGMPGKFTLHIRNNVAHGFLTVWDVSGEGRELTPMDPRYSGGGRWSGYGMADEVYVVPGGVRIHAG